MELPFEREVLTESCPSGRLPHTHSFRPFEEDLSIAYRPLQHEISFLWTNMLNNRFHAIQFESINGNNTFLLAD